MLQTKKKSITIRMLSITMAFVLCATILAGAPIRSYAAEPKKNVSVDDMKKSMEKVIKSVDDMKDMISPEKAEDLEQILSGFFNSAVSVGGSVIGVIDGASTFLQLIGVVKNANMKALADISEQLKLISDKLEVMDGKLDDIITQMTAMQAEGEFKDRTNRASDMNKYWVDFETEYMENQMDSLMREYEATLRDLAKIWIEDRNDDARHESAYEPMTNKVVILYNTKSGAAKHTYMNNVDLTHHRDKVDNPDPYTIYADEFDTYAEGYLILNDTYLPHRGNIGWNVNSYRNDLKNYFKGQIKDLNNRDDYEIYNIDPTQWTDEDVEKFANDAADAVLFRLGYYAVNKSADFPAKVKQQFNNYCNHMVSPQEGMCALLQAFYLSHAFEYEVDEDIKAVCNQMMLKTGVYSMFTMNVLGASAYTTDTEKQEAANSMCNAIDKLSNMLENGITGHGNYCYVTNTLVDYGEADYTGSVDVNYRTRGQIAEYISYGNGRINSNYKYDDKKNNNTPVFLGDTNTMVIAYHLASNGESFDQNYMAKNLAKQPVAQKSSVITSLRGEQNLPLDGSCRMKSHRILGSWFNGDPTVTLNSLPSSCTFEYIAYKRGINGSLYTGGLNIPSANKMLIGTSVYGESHWYWEKDELALMGGPVNDPSYTENMPPRVRTDISFWGDDYYRQSFNNSVSYNCLVQVPLTKLSAGDGPYPLVDLIVGNYDIKSRIELKEMINKALDTLDNGNWTEESKARVFEAIINSGQFLGEKNKDMEEVDVAMRRISTAIDGLERVKQQQNVTLRFEPQLIDESDIIANDQILNGIIAEDIKGEVNYQLVGVNDNNLQGYFEVDKDNGSITVKKGLPVGEYKLMIKASSSGNDEFEPIEVNLIAGIMVK